MLYFNINFMSLYWKLFILIGLLFLIIGFIAWVILSYYVLKWFKMNIDKDYIYFNKYNTGCEHILSNFGNYPIKRIYLIRQPITKGAKLLINIITLYKFEKEVKKYIDANNNQHFFPQHTSIIAEIELPNKLRKNILIEKNNCIKLSLNYYINEQQDIRRINIGKKKLTVNSILKKTQERIGNDKFFNWHICRNNCQILTKEILVTLDKFDEKNNNFVYQSDFAKKVNFSDFSLHIINSIVNMHNIIENFIGKSFIF
jgi:hypothetical protein